MIMSGILIHGGMFLLVDVTNVWDSVLSCCWDECCEDVCYSDDIVLEHVPECDSPIDSCPEVEPLSVQGRLQKCSGFWKEKLEASQFVLDIVTNGYQLPFIAFPQPMIAKNHRSALEHSKFVKESIGDLVQSHCVRESLSCPKVCSPLQVVKNAKGKLRLVIDLASLCQPVS